MGGSELDFFPDSSDMRHQRVFITVGVIPPRRFTKLINGDDAPGISAKSLKNLIFLGGKGKPFFAL